MALFAHGASGRGLLQHQTWCVARASAAPYFCCGLRTPPEQVLAADIDLLNPPADFEKRKHKLKRLVQSPNSFFMDVKCQVLGAAAAAASPRESAA